MGSVMASIKDGILTGTNAYITVWLVLIVVFIVLELISVGLTSIWFAAGAAVALLAACLKAPFALQVFLFVAASAVFLAAIRPWARKFVNQRTIRTNSESLIGQTIRVTERVSNMDQTGTGLANGLEWTVRAANDKQVIEKGQLAAVVRITGVKLIVEPVKEV